MEDALAVLEWRNDPTSVAASKSGALVKTADHLPWFAKSIDDPDRDIFIATEGDRRIGMVRFDREDDAWLVSINLAPDERGKGYGDRVLLKAIAEVGRRHYLAEIKADNLASIRMFERCGFRQVGIGGEFLHFMRH
jgi:RimJ/RimL family protein N-acetyltransferase